MTLKGAPRKQVSRIGRPSRDEIRERKKNVLEITKAIFIEDGYENLTIEAVSERSGISKKSVYSWFTNKSSLMKEVITDIADRTRDIMLKGAAAESRNIDDDLYNIAISILDAFCSKESISLSRFLIRESYKYPEFRQYIMSYALRDLEGILVDIFEKYQGSVTNIDSKALAHRFLNIVTGNLSIIIIHDLDIPNAAERKRQAKEASRIFIHGILK